MIAETVLIVALTMACPTEAGVAGIGVGIEATRAALADRAVYYGCAVLGPGERGLDARVQDGRVFARWPSLGEWLWVPGAAVGLGPDMTGAAAPPPVTTLAPYSPDAELKDAAEWVRRLKQGPPVK